MNTNVQLVRSQFENELNCGISLALVSSLRNNGTLTESQYLAARRALVRIYNPIIAVNAEA